MIKFLAYFLACFMICGILSVLTGLPVGGILAVVFLAAVVAEVESHRKKNIR